MDLGQHLELIRFKSHRMTHNQISDPVLTLSAATKGLRLSYNENKNLRVRVLANFEKF